MKILKRDLEKIEESMKREWVITNGIGGICSSSIIGANTRKYHGLLVAPLSPPAKRYTILSKVDESVKVGNKSYNLYTNICENYISDGYKYLKCFKKEYIPEFEYEVEDVKITKKIAMVYGRNIVTVTYYVESGKKPIKLILTPVMTFRDFHTLVPQDHHYDLKQEIKENRKVRVEIDNNSSNPVYLFVRDGNYIEHYNDVFENMYYIKEEERGFYPKENLIVPGRFEIDISKNEKRTITFVASLEENIEEIDGDIIIQEEIERLDKIIKKSELLNKTNTNTEFVKDLIIASDQFVIFRPSFGTHSILAGIPWFLDWGRDSMIAYEGILLKTKRFNIARDILLTFTRDVKYGLVPNRLFWI